MKQDNLVPKKALFLHIQKTAGSSIVDLARLAYDNEQVVSHGDYLLEPPSLDGLDEVLDTRGIDPSLFANRDFISGHFGFDFAQPLMHNRYSFTFLRDPIERILSYYYFCRIRDPKQYEIYALAQQFSLDEFLLLGLKRPSIKACIWNNQTLQLANGYGSSIPNILDFTSEDLLSLAISHLKEFSYIGFAETFEEDRDYILKKLNIMPPEMKIVSNANPGRPTAKELPPSTLEILEELTQLDRALYKEAWRRKNSFFRKCIRKWF